MEKSRPKVILEKNAERATRWIGSTQSLVTHTFIFIVSFALPVFNLVSFTNMLLVLTTLVSLEAIYLSIFIQMSVNKNTADIEVIQEDVEDIQEYVEDIQEDIEGIQEDVEDIQEDVEEIQEHVEDIQEEIEETADENTSLTIPVTSNKDMLAAIQQTLQQLQAEIAALKEQVH